MKKPQEFQFAEDMYFNVHLHPNYAQTDTCTAAATVHVEGAQDGGSCTLAFQQDGTGRQLTVDVDGYEVALDGAIPHNDGVTLLLSMRFVTVNGVKTALVGSVEYEIPS